MDAPTGPLVAAGLDVFTVTPWHEDGHRRLYVSDQRGSLGYLDTATGEVVLVAEHHRGVVEQALRDAGEEPRPDVVPLDEIPLPLAPRTDEDVATTVERPVSGPERIWVDLTASRGGLAARGRGTVRPRRAPTETLAALLAGAPTPHPPLTDADGDRKVTAEIAHLVRADPLWQVLHGGGGDHLVIGPGGVFALTVKVHPGAQVSVSGRSITVDDTRVPYVRAALHEREHVERLLSAASQIRLTVTALVVMVGTETLSTTMPPPVGVVVLDRRHLRRWLRAQPETLAPETVAAVFDAAQQPTTWQG
ncbi:MAG: hypothetical protein FWD18_04210 [Micrococcales bacterium]|nr:hypothetical protein [Micrococcales bacterium]